MLPIGVIANCEDSAVLLQEDGVVASCEHVFDSGHNLHGRVALLLFFTNTAYASSAEPLSAALAQLVSEKSPADPAQLVARREVPMPGR